MNESDVATKKAAPAAITGPASRTLRRPKRSMAYPAGRLAESPSAIVATNTSEATPMLTSKDLASTGRTGAAMPEPRPIATAGRWSDRNSWR